MIKIELNNDIISFLNRVTYNIVNRQNLNENIKVTNKNRNDLLNNMKKYDPSIESIYYNKKLITENPYYKNINLKNISTGEFKYSNELMKKDVAINISWILPDKNRELNEYFILGALEEDLNIPVLRQGNEIWMSPTLSEQNTINPCIEKATGHVLTFGLGLGYFPYMCSLKDDIKDITIVEYSQEVINLFEEYILPQFEFKEKIKIVKGDMFDYLNQAFLDKFDYIFVDIWKNNEDGLEILNKIFEQINYKGNIDYWIENSCYVVFKMLNFLYFNHLAKGTLSKLLMDFSGEDKELLKKIHKYYRGKDYVITNSDELKELLYDVNVIREILSIKL